MLGEMKVNSRNSNDSIQDMREGNKTSTLSGLAGSGIRRVATCAGNGTEFIAFSFQFLDEVRASPGLYHLHVEVAVGQPEFTYQYSHQNQSG
jgi:hypothetical protein